MRTAHQLVRALPAMLLALAAARPAAAQSALSEEQLAKLKAATVFVKVRAGAVGSSGSGFLVRADGTTGHLVTNYHVLDVPLVPAPGQTPADVKMTIEVVLDSGTGKERTVPAVPAALDSDRDLAVLRVEGVKDLPAPIDLADPPKVMETMPVYVCGFPYGTRLAGGDRNPAVSIGPASVSSIRTDSAGRVSLVQLNGALNPGNSGGPVVTAGGKLVGVAVATIKGSGIGFAIPQQDVTAMLRGRPGTPRIVMTGDGHRLEVPVIDPLGVVKSAAAYVRPDAPPKADPAKPEVMPGAKKVTLAPAPAGAAAPVELPAGGKSLWVQVELATADATVRTAPAEVKVGDEPGPRAPRGPVRPGPVGGSALPPATETLPPRPEGVTDLSELNRTPEKFDGKSVRTDALTNCDVTPRVDGYELTVTFESNNPPSNLRVIVPKDLGLQISDLGAQPGERFAVRLDGTVKKPTARGEVRHTLEVREVAFLTADGDPAVKVKPAAGAPSGEPTLSAVNRFPEKFRGRTVTLEVLFKGVGQAGVGYPVHVANDNDARPLNLDFFTSEDLATQARDELPRGTFIAKLTCVVERVNAGDGHGVLGVKKVEVVNPQSGEVAKTLTGAGKVIYPPDTPAPKPPAPTSQVAAPAPGAKPTAAPTAEPAQEQSGNRLFVFILGGAAAVVAVIVVAAVVGLLLLGKGKANAPARREPARPARRPTEPRAPDTFPGFGE